MEVFPVSQVKQMEIRIDQRRLNYAKLNLSRFLSHADVRPSGTTEPVRDVDYEVSAESWITRGHGVDVESSPVLPKRASDSAWKPNSPDFSDLFVDLSPADSPDGSKLFHVPEVHSRNPASCCLFRNSAAEQFHQLLIAGLA
jgi:hypothetical protein